MVLKVKLIGFFTCLLISTWVAGEEFTSMYGFSLGEPIENVSSNLGEPDRLIDLDGGAIVRAYLFEDHYLVITSVPPSNDFIYSIQVTGNQLPMDQSFAGIRLGDQFQEVVDKFGEPTRSRAATDLETGNQLSDTTIHFYGENYSFEEVEGKITSIKINYDSTLSSDNPADEKLMGGQPIEFKKVRDYILDTDYPELFGDDYYRIAIEAMQKIDFENDGLVEVVVLFRPHYAQSPTIVIYQIQEDGAVKRIREGLAPGPLVPRGDYFLDSHALGEGVDFHVEEMPNSTQASREFAMTATDSSGFGMFVQYRDFFHADSRAGNSSYIDMTLHEPFSHSRNCFDFEFSKVDSIRVGYTKDDNKIGFIAALVGNEIYVYEVRGITADGFLEKTLLVKDINKDKKARDGKARN